MNLRYPGHVVSLAPNDSTSRAFDPDCFEFTAYLGRRLGVGSELASELLGQWLRTYEPSASGT